MESKNIKYIPQVDHLRAFAALLIVVYHGTQLIWHELAFNEPFSEKYWVEHWIVVDNPLKALVIEGHTAVSLFMVLSGFIFTIGAHKNRLVYSKFIINRLLRTYPLFILLLFTGIYAFPGKFEFLSFLQTVLALSNANHGIDIGSFSAMFWAIAVEWQFYLIFPFLIVILNKKGVLFLFGVLLVFILMRAIACLGGANIRDLSYFTIVGRMDQFLIGMGLAVIYKNNIAGIWLQKMKLPFFLIACFVLVFTLYLFNHHGGWPGSSWWKIFWPTVEGVVIGLFLFSYLVASKCLPEVISRLFSGVGKISYSMYLFHFIYIGIVIKYKLFFTFLSSHLFFNAFLNTVLIIVPITIASSLLTYTFIEKPFLDMRQVYKY